MKNRHPLGEKIEVKSTTQHISPPDLAIQHNQKMGQMIGFRKMLSPRELEHFMQAMRTAGDVYFINYKNSSAGTGGVGTVTRDMMKIFPEMHFVYQERNYIASSSPKRSYNVSLSESESDAFHARFAKLYLWPVLHGLKPKISERTITQLRPIVDTCWERFAETTLSASPNHERAIFWVNDYVLNGVVGNLRRKAPTSTIIFSWRTPFGTKKPPDLGEKDRLKLVKSLVGADLVTFHRQKDLDNFLLLTKEVSHLLPLMKTHGSKGEILYGNRRTRLRVVPMGSNPDYRLRLAESPLSQIVKKEYDNLKEDRRLVTGISRFEESKGIEYEIDCIAELLNKHPDMKSRFNFVRFSYLSKQKAETDYYYDFYKRINQKILHINDKYGDVDWKPIVNVLDKKLNDSEVTGLLRATDILLIGAYADGFNHLALEGVLGRTSSDKPIQLILGNIGARDYLEGYLPVDPQSVEDGAAILYHALSSEEHDIASRYSRLLKHGKGLSVENWVLSVLGASINLNIPNWKMEQVL